MGVNGSGTRPINQVIDVTLRPNGSNVFTYALIVGSAAIDAGLNGRAKDPGLDGTFFNGDDGPVLTTDQRGPGFNRIVNGGVSATVDIGAYEFVPKTDFVVDSKFDLVDGNHSPGEYSLREAIQQANTTPGKQTITFAPNLAASAISLNGSHLSVTDSLEIVGPNGGLLIDAGEQSRIFEHSRPLTLRNLNLTGGNGTKGTAPNEIGSAGFGGAINGFDPIAPFEASLTLINSAVFGNKATSQGGGIWNNSSVTIINSTISGNLADSVGGGIAVTGGGKIVNSTITGNKLTTGLPNGGGLHLASGALTLNNTIVAGNLTDNGLDPGDISGTVSGKNNVIGHAGSAGGLVNGDNGNITGVNGAGTRNINTILNTTLQNNGGNVRTHSLAVGSVALSAGDDNLAVDELGNPLNFDGRGAPFLRFGQLFDPVVVVMPTDIGAYQEQPFLIVNTLFDEISDPNTFSLREAILQSNSQKFGEQFGGLWDWITFEQGLTGTIALQGTQLNITGDVRISGPGADKLTISGGFLSRIFSTGSAFAVELSGLKLTLGNAGAGPGGAIFNNSHLTLRNVWIENNKASSGGGILHAGAGVELSLIDSTVSGNFATANGGGISSGEAMRIVNSTISGNSANEDGGGIYNIDDTVTIINSTITGNRADADGNNPANDNGGGIWTFNDGVTFTTIHNSIVAGNFVGVGNNPDDVRNKPLEAPSAFNIIGHSGSAGGLTDGKLGNIVGVNGAGTLAVNSILNTTLSNHATPIHQLIPGSLALNTGAEHLAEDEFGTPLRFDQIGNRRVIGSGIDRGAHEFPGLSDILGWNTATGKWNFGLNNGTALNQIVGPGWNPASGWDIHQGDFNGDGITDAAGRTDGGAWFVIDGVTKLSTHWGNWGSDAAQKWNDPAFQGFVGVADMNGDGKDDVVGKNFAGHIFISLSDGSSFGPSTKWGAIGATGYVAHRLGDFNGDGLADVVSFRGNGDRWVNENSGMSTLVLDFHGNFGSQVDKGWRNFMVADVGGDGFDDIIQQDETGFWTIGHADGQNDGAFIVQVANKWDPNAFSDFHVGDFNGDGREEFVARTASNQFFVNMAQLNGSLVTVAFGSLAAASPFNTTVGDFNGDGITDVMALRTTDAAFFGLISNGSKFTNKAFGMWNNFIGNNRIFGGDLD